MLTQRKLNIGVLTTSEHANKKLLETIEARGHTYVILDPRKLYLYISEHPRGYDRFYIESDGDEPTRIHGNTIDALIPRFASNVNWGSSVLRFLTENIGIYCYNSAWSHIMAGDKSFTLQRLSSSGVKVPRTIVCESPAHVAWAVRKLGTPIICKTTHGSQGKTVAIVDSVTSANSVFEFLFNAGMKCILEEFIDCGSSDYRVWTVGSKVAVSMKRTATDKKQWKANISLGGTGEKVQLSVEDEAICIQAATCLGLGVAGVDLVKNSKTGMSYVIEVNSCPGTAVINFTGHNVFEDVVSFVEDNCPKQRSSDNKSTSATMRENLLFDKAIYNTIAYNMKRSDDFEKHLKSEMLEKAKALNLIK